MAYTVKVKNSYEVFGFGDIRREILDTIRHELGREFAQFVEDALTVNADNIADGLDDIVRYCESFDSETDDIEAVLNDIRLTAEYTKEDLADFY